MKYLRRFEDRIRNTPGDENVDIDFALKNNTENKIIPNGEYIGSDRVHDCEKNSLKHKEYDIYEGFLILYDPSYKKLNRVKHWFNVKDNKVYEFTNLYLKETGNKFEDLIYIGHKVDIDYLGRKIKYKTNLNLKKFEDAQFDYSKELNPKFWTDFSFDEKIRKKLLTIAYEFYADFEYDVPISDIILTGSLANYNYNKFSDLDVHVVVDFSEIDKNVELVKSAVDGKRFMWNLRNNIKIKGHDVELYIQDISEEHKASGMFSLMENEWIKKPKYDEPTIDKELVKFKYLTYKSGIDRFDTLSNEELMPELATKYYLYAKELKDKIMKSRKFGLEKSGEFSVENLVFKKLRNGKDFEKLIDVIGKLHDKIYSQ